MNVYDQAARYAAKLDPHAFFAWILQGIWDVLEFVGWLDTRTLPFPGEKDRTCDTVAHFRRRAVAAGAPNSWAVPVEFQSEPEPGMLEEVRLRPLTGRVVRGILANLAWLGRRSVL